jgi:hypothetical protein
MRRKPQSGKDCRNQADYFISAAASKAPLTTISKVVLLRASRALTGWRIAWVSFHPGVGFIEKTADF